MFQFCVYLQRQKVNLAHFGEITLPQGNSPHLLAGRFGESSGTALLPTCLKHE